MNMAEELQLPPDREALLVARLAVSFTLLALAPYDSWSHQGDPAEMAAYVVKTAKKNGNLGFVMQVMGIGY